MKQRGKKPKRNKQKISECGTTSNILIFMPIKEIKLNHKISLTKEAENVEVEQRTDGRNIFYTEGII